MQNWEVLQKKISEMNKDAFITFAKEKLYCNGFISAREDKAIHKKLEELKNGIYQR